MLIDHPTIRLYLYLIGLTALAIAPLIALWQPEIATAIRDAANIFRPTATGTPPPNTPHRPTPSTPPNAPPPPAADPSHPHHSPHNNHHHPKPGKHKPTPSFLRRLVCVLGLRYRAGVWYNCGAVLLHRSGA